MFQLLRRGAENRESITRIKCKIVSWRFGGVRKNGFCGI